MQQTKTTKFHYAWVMLVAVFCVKGIAGAVFYNTPSVMYLPMSQTFETGITEIALMNTVSSIVSALLAGVIARFISRPGVNVKMATFFGIALFGMSYTAMGFATNQYIIYGLTIGTSIGSILGWMQGLTLLINNWFVKHRGLALGLVGCAAGIFGIGVQPLVANVLVAEGWQNTFLFVGAGAVVVVLLIILLIVREKPKNGVLPLGANENQQDGVAAQTAAVAQGMSAKKALKTPALWVIIASLFFMSYSTVFYFQTPTYSASLGYTTEEIGTIMSLFSLGQALGAVSIGVLCDKIGAKKTMSIVFGSIIVYCVLYLMGSISIVPMMAGVFINGAMLNGAMVTLPLIVGQYFGQKDFSRIFGYLLTAMYATGIVSTPMHAMVYDIFQSYNYMLYVIIGCGAIGFVLTIVLGKLVKNIKENWEE